MIIEDLFGKISKLINFVKISSHQIKKYGPQSLSSNNISKLNQIVIFSKTPNIKIATNKSRITVLCSDSIVL